MKADQYPLRSPSRLERTVAFVRLMLDHSPHNIGIQRYRSHKDVLQPLVIGAIGMRETGGYLLNRAESFATSSIDDYVTNVSTEHTYIIYDTRSRKYEAPFDSRYDLSDGRYSKATLLSNYRRIANYKNANACAVTDSNKPIYTPDGRVHYESVDYGTGGSLGRSKRRLFELSISEGDIEMISTFSVGPTSIYLLNSRSLLAHAEARRLREGLETDDPSFRKLSIDFDRRTAGNIGPLNIYQAWNIYYPSHINVLRLQLRYLDINWWSGGAVTNLQYKSDLSTSISDSASLQGKVIRDLLDRRGSTALNLATMILRRQTGGSRKVSSLYAERYFLPNFRGIYDAIF